MKEEGLPVKAGFYLARLNQEDNTEQKEMTIIEVRIFQGNSYFMHCDGLTNQSIRITHWEGKHTKGTNFFKENK